jgi:hypothetical protein
MVGLIRMVRNLRHAADAQDARAHPLFEKGVVCHNLLPLYDLGVTAE